jgi:hypothetical protein
MDRTPPLWATVPLGLVMGVFAGTILASLWLNFALREGVDAFKCTEPGSLDTRLRYAAMGMVARSCCRRSACGLR